MTEAFLKLFGTASVFVSFALYQINYCDGWLLHNCQKYPLKPFMTPLHVMSSIAILMRERIKEKGQLAISNLLLN